MLEPEWPARVGEYFVQFGILLHVLDVLLNGFLTRRLQTCKIVFEAVHLLTVHIVS